ncbi:MAG: N-acetylmuramoyl-L-alanine amidase [Clostridiales bacterium]|nr:N-acetylmuramoyl-L-alanine amidase [Clostridiales bacterium]
MFAVIRLDKALFFIVVLLILITAIFFISGSNTDLAYISASRAREHMPVLVIDPGHGGEDGGAISREGVRESVINLDIGLKMSALAGFLGFPSMMTRETEELEYPETANTVAKRKRHDQETRVELISSVENAVVISVHQNCFPSSKARGPQSFYSKGETSQRLGFFAQSCMDAAVYPENRRLSVPVADNIFLMRSIDCPAVLVECGFLSNHEESKLLGTDSYRLKIATALICAYGQFLDEDIA